MEVHRIAGDKIQLIGRSEETVGLGLAPDKCSPTGFLVVIINERAEMIGSKPILKSTIEHGADHCRFEFVRAICRQVLKNNCMAIAACSSVARFVMAANDLLGTEGDNFKLSVAAPDAEGEH